LSLRWNSSISDRFLGVANLSPSLRRGTSRLCTSSTKPLCSTPPAKWISTTRARSSRESNSSASNPWFRALQYKLWRSSKSPRVPAVPHWDDLVSGS
jgi:hypothetical protein